MRRGVALIHVLICAGLVAVLIAVLLPMVEKVRKRAARVHCLNSLKTIGAGVHGYVDTHGTLPPGTVPNPDLPPDQRLAFTVSLLPHFGYATLCKAFDPAAAWDAPRNAKAAEGNSLTQYRCLGRDHYGEAIAFAYYVGVAGVGSDAASRPLDSPGVGAFGYDRRVKFDQIKDGVANTLLAIETGRDLGPWTRGGPTTVRGLDPADDPLLGEGRAFGGNHTDERTLFNRRRSLGANVLLIDGSTRTLTDSTAADLIARLATIAGGEEVPNDW